MGPVPSTPVYHSVRPKVVPSSLQRMPPQLQGWSMVASVQPKYRQLSS